jgi:hypothetical protein
MVKRAVFSRKLLHEYNDFVCVVRIFMTPMTNEFIIKASKKK